MSVDLVLAIVHTIPRFVLYDIENNAVQPRSACRAPKFWLEPVRAQRYSSPVINLDVTRYPIVFIEFVGQISNGELAEYFDKQRAITQKALRDGSFYVTISMGSLALSREQRTMISCWIDSIPEEESARVLGSFVVMDSVMIRGILIAIKWQSRRLKNVYSVASRAEGIRKANTLLSVHGIVGVQSS